MPVVVSSPHQVPVSIHSGLNGGVEAGLVSPKIFCKTSPTFLRQIGFW